MRRGLLFLLAGALGAAVAVLPAVAGSETGPTIMAETSAAATTAKNTAGLRAK